MPVCGSTKNSRLTRLHTTRQGTDRALVYARLQQRGVPLRNTDLFARILASQVSGAGELPARLGLDSEAYHALMARHFVGAPTTGSGNMEPWQSAARKMETIENNSDTRDSERQDLAHLLLEHRAEQDLSEEWLARIIAAGCMGGNHLWEDLGLWSRAELTALMRENFPGLAALNVRDMKWKKFLYRQLCEREGLRLCPAPSCQVCADYEGCFSPDHT